MTEKMNTFICAQKVSYMCVVETTGIFYKETKMLLEESLLSKKN